jgi:hypothetical protein
MATLPVLPNLTQGLKFAGNSAYAVDAQGIIWLVQPTQGASVDILSSIDNGVSFTNVSLISLPTGSIPLDPAILLTPSGMLYILGQTGGLGASYLSLWYLDTSTLALSGPFQITGPELLGSDYDLAMLVSGNLYVVTSVLVASGETLNGYEVTPAGLPVSTDTFVTEQELGGVRYSSISLWADPTSYVEVYAASNPKKFKLGSDLVTTISRATRSVGAAPTALQPIGSFQARYVTCRMTVFGMNGNRYMYYAYYSQDHASLIGSIGLGYSSGSLGTWNFYTVRGTAVFSLFDPVFMPGVVLPVLVVLGGPYTSLQGGLPATLYDVDPTEWEFTERADYRYAKNFSTLRASRSSATASMPWSFLAIEGESGVCDFFSGYNAPPTVVLTPTAVAAQLGIVYTFDASQTTDINLDPLEFFWSLSDPTGLATLIQEGSKASVVLPFSAGALARQLTLTVAVTDLTLAGVAIHPPVTASAVLNYPTVLPPTIAASNPINANRNSNVTIYAAVADSSNLPVDYSWAQTGGTAVHILDGGDTAFLSINTGGALISGETLSFTLTVSDGLNAPVSEAFQVIVAARVFPGETDLLARSLWSGDIANRNEDLIWGSLALLGGITDFTSAMRSPLILSAVETTLIDFSMGFESSSDLALNGAAVIGPDSNIILTSALAPGAGSAWALTQVPTGAFSGSFTFRYTGAVSRGLIFWVQTQGSTALSTDDYAWDTASIFPGVAVRIDLFVDDPVSGQTGIILDASTNGIPGSLMPGSGTVEASGNLVLCTYTYFNQVMSIALEDLSTGALYSVSSQIDIPQVLNASLAYVGFTAGGETSGLTVEVFDWTLTSGSNMGSYILISPVSILVVRDEGTYRVFLPDPTDTILGAVHANIDSTIVLTEKGFVHQFLPLNPEADTDYPLNTINISLYSSYSYQNLQVTPPFAGKRVLILFGIEGLLLLQVDAQTFEIYAEYALTSDTGLLYGSANVQWLRTDGVESLHTGRMLIGTADSEGNDYETEIDLASRSVLGTWDSTQIRSQTVTTGELLTTTGEDYSGAPLPPVLLAASISGSSVRLSWTQTRADLVTGYQVYGSINGGDAAVIGYVQSGAVFAATLSGMTINAEYTLTMKALSLDGPSRSSNPLVVVL